MTRWIWRTGPSCSRKRAMSPSGDCRSRFAFMTCSFFRASVIAARKSLHVSGRFGEPRPRQEEGEAERRKTRLSSKNAPFGRSAAATSSSLGPDFRAQARASSPSRQVSPPFTRLVQPLKAEPRSGPGRLPKAPRCHACEAQPRAPHPTGSGYPSPAKLSLCPTSGSPLEAPPREQDRAMISAVWGTGIRNEKIFFTSVYKSIA